MLPRILSDLVYQRFPTLEHKNYSFKIYPNQSDLQKGCYIFETVINGATKHLWVNNFSGKDVHIPKNFKLGYIELPESPQYTALSPMEDLKSSVDDVMQCHFRKSAEADPQRSSIVTNEVAAATTVSL